MSKLFKPLALFLSLSVFCLQGGGLAEKNSLSEGLFASDVASEFDD